MTSYLLLLLLLAACVAPLEPIGTRRWLALGDSITARRDFASPPIVSYPELARTRLSGWTIYNAGIGALDTSQLVECWRAIVAPPPAPTVTCGDIALSRLQAVDRMPAGTPMGVVTLMLGVNDHTYRIPGRPRVPIETFRSNLLQLVALAKNLPGRPRVVLMTATYVKPSGDGTLDPVRLQDYNRITKSIALSHGLGLVDLYAVTQRFAGTWTSLTDNNDGVHPGNSMQQEMWAAIEREVFR